MKDPLEKVKYLASNMDTSEAREDLWDLIHEVELARERLSPAGWKMLIEIGGLGLEASQYDLLADKARRAAIQYDFLADKARMAVENEEPFDIMDHIDTKD